MNTASTTELPDDLLAIRSDLLRAIEDDAALRRHRRRRVLRTTGLGATAALAVSGTALAAGSALGVINLGNGVQAQKVQSYPAYNVVTHEYVQVKGENLYIYHLTGGPSNLSGCPNKPADIYVESTKPLDSAQLKLAGALASGATEGGAEQQFEAVPGLKGVGDGCGDAGVESTVGKSPSTP